MDAQGRMRSHGKLILKQVSGRACGAMERVACTGTGFLAGLLTPPPGGPWLEQSVSDEWHPKKGTNTGAVQEELLPIERTHTEETHGGQSPMGGTPQWSRAGSVCAALQRKEWQRECVRNWLQLPFPILLCHWGLGGKENEQWSCIGNKGGVGKDVFLFLIILIVILTSNILISQSWGYFAYDSNSSLSSTQPTRLLL